MKAGRSVGKGNLHRQHFTHAFAAVALQRFCADSSWRWLAQLVAVPIQDVGTRYHLLSDAANRRDGWVPREYCLTVGLPQSTKIYRSPQLRLRGQRGVIIQKGLARYLAYDRVCAYWSRSILASLRHQLPTHSPGEFLCPPSYGCPIL
jgi:hypothetical protein